MKKQHISQPFFFTATMGRRYVTDTHDAACGPDVSWPGWPNWDRRDETTATEYKDLQDAMGKQQHEADEARVQRYYQRQAERRKRHAFNQKEKCWEAQERLDMSFNDYPIKKDMGSSAANLAGAATDVACGTGSPMAQDAISVPTLADVQQRPDKSWLPPTTDGLAAAKPSPLAGAFFAVAKNLDASNGKKRKLEEPSASSTTSNNPQWVTLNAPYLAFAEMQPPTDTVAHGFIPKSYPQPRTFGYSRLVPKLDGKYSANRSELKPPFGIQLIEDFGKWKENFSK